VCPCTWTELPELDDFDELCELLLWELEWPSPCPPPPRPRAKDGNSKVHGMSDAIATARYLERDTLALLSARRRWDGRAVRMCQQPNRVEALPQALLAQSRELGTRRSRYGCEVFRASAAALIADRFAAVMGTSLRVRGSDGVNVEQPAWPCPVADALKISAAAAEVTSAAAKVAASSTEVASATAEITAPGVAAARIAAAEIASAPAAIVLRAAAEVAAAAGVILIGIGRSRAAVAAIGAAANSAAEATPHSAAAAERVIEPVPGGSAKQTAKHAAHKAASAAASPAVTRATIPRPGTTVAGARPRSILARPSSPEHVEDPAEEGPEDPESDDDDDQNHDP
jgi:hypothetical protein